MSGAVVKTEAKGILKRCKIQRACSLFRAIVLFPVVVRQYLPPTWYDILKSFPVEGTHKCIHRAPVACRVVGLGAAFLVEPAGGTLPPWGVVEVSVTAFNDTPGRYSDKLEVAFTGGKAELH